MQAEENPPTTTRRPRRSTLRRALEEAALLLASAGVVTLFCQVLDISVQKTAVYSLASLLLVVCCVYKRWLNDNVPSALVIGLLIGLATIFFYNFQNILLKDTGLVKRFKDPTEVLSEAGHLIEKAHHEIWMFGVNFHISSVDRRNAILDRLKQGVTIRYLILDPFSPNLDRIAKDFDQPTAEIKDECTKGIKSILYIQEQWKQLAPTAPHPGELEIRLYDTTPRARIYVFDPVEESGNTIYIPYMNRVESPKLPGYLLRNSKSGVYSAYFGGIQKLWSEALPMTSFLSAHPELKQN
jgi:hypothetical protein